MQYLLPFIVSLVVFGILSFGYIAVGAGAGFGGGGSKARDRGRAIIAVAAVYVVCVLLFGGAVFIWASVAAAVCVAIFWMLRR